MTGTAANLTAGNATLAAGATALASARTIGGTSFDGTANIAVGLAATATALATARTIGGTSFDGTGNIAITTNANLTGDVTSSGNATTIADDKVDEANLKSDNSPTNDYVLTAKSSAAGGLTWAATAAGYSAPTIGSTSIASGSTNTTIAGLTLTAPALTGTTTAADITLSGNLIVNGTTINCRYCHINSRRSIN